MVANAQAQDKAAAAAAPAQPDFTGAALGAAGLKVNGGTGRQNYPGAGRDPNANLQPISDFINKPTEWWHNPDHTAWNQLVSQLQAAGWKTNGSRSSVQAGWETVLEGASYNTQYTPAEYLAQVAMTRGLAGAAGTGSGSGAYNGPVAHTVFTNEFDAKKIVNDALGAYLGADATPKQLEAFYKQLHDVEAANPTVVTPHGKSAQTQDGGSNAAQVAIDFAKSQDNYAETQAATTLTSWLEENITKSEQNRII